MKNAIPVFLFILLFAFSACKTATREKYETAVPIEYTVASRSPLFNKNLTKFKLETYHNSLIVLLNLVEMKNIAFPIAKEYGDTLFETAFHFDFYKDGKIIHTDYKKNLMSLRWRTDSSAIANNLSFISDTISMNTANQLIYEIPFHAFHNLKQGKHLLELRMWQDTFKGVSTLKKAGSNSPETVSNYAVKSLFDATVKFEVVLPPIYKSKVYGFGLQLRNDSTFSPTGMDNTLWNSSYPDIYWTLYYPANKPYAQTHYQKSTDAYTDSDTFDLYHYYANDSLGIGAFDHDDLSTDDGLGYWTGSMDHLRREPKSRIKFGFVKWFDIKVGKAEIVN